MQSCLIGTLSNSGHRESAAVLTVIDFVVLGLVRDLVLAEAIDLVLCPEAVMILGNVAHTGRLYEAAFLGVDPVACQETVHVDVFVPALDHLVATVH